jgi:hypothetical protein
VAFYIDKSLTHHTHAVRDIQPGEELSISYLDSFSAREERQDRAQRSWGFKCTCAQCTLPKSEAKASDRRLQAIYDTENKLAAGDDKVTPRMAEKLIRLYKEERMDFKISGAYTLAAMNYNMFGNEKMARKYADLAVEAGVVESGPESADVVAMQKLAEDPRAHFTWNQKPVK